MNDLLESSLLSDVEELIRRAFAEDAASNDLTTMACIDVGWQGKVQLIAKQDGCIAGLRFIPWIFKAFDPKIETRLFFCDGQRCSKGTILAVAVGPAASLLSAERVALNFLQHLCGVATQTAQCVEAVAGTKCQIRDTRKTILGMRSLQKYAVRMGGGVNHRMHLEDRILIKDNHLAMSAYHGQTPLSHCIGLSKQRYPHVQIQVEIEDVADLEEALSVGVESILLDNMSVEEVRQCVNANRGRAFLEASGNMTLVTIPSYAQTGVNAISIGALTHSAQALDISIKFR